MQSLSEEILRTLLPFSGLKKRQLENFLARCREKEYGPGQVIYEEGAPADNFYLLLKGRILALSRQGGEDREIELLKRGNSFGLISLLTSEPHSVTMMAIEPSVVLEISGDDFREFLNKNPLLALDFSRILSRKVKKRAGAPKKIFQSLKTGVCAITPSPGATEYMRDLALSLRGETAKEIIVIQCSFSQEFSLPGIIGTSVPVAEMTGFREDDLDRYIVKQDVSCLCVHLDKPGLDHFFSLLNCLCERYHFVFYEFPFGKEEEISRFILPADRIHFLSAAEKEDWSGIRALVRKIQAKSPPRMRCLSLSSSLQASPAQVSSLYSVLPARGSDGYRTVLRGIARELGEKTVGVVLGSGAAFGLAHIGVLKVLEEEKVPIDIISGTSMGALIATLWGLGYSIQEMESLALYFGRKLLFASFASFAFPFKGFLRSRQLERLLKDIFGKKTFADLKRRVRVCIFDFVKREPRIIEEGQLYKAVAASCAMPGVFEPITYKEEIFLDGGILAPLPVSTVLDYAKKVIAVNITPSREEIIRDTVIQGRKKFTIFDFIFGSIETMQRQFIEDAQKSADVVIHPDMKGLSWVEFTKVKEFVRIGEETTRAQLDSIRKLIET